MASDKRNGQGNGHNHAMPTDKRYAHVVGWGKYIPEKVMTNDDLAKIVDTSDEWIQQRTGIRERHIADPKETTSTMSVQAAREALWVAGLNPSDLEPAWPNGRKRMPKTGAIGSVRRTWKASRAGGSERALDR